VHDPHGRSLGASRCGVRLSARPRRGDGPDRDLRQALLRGISESGLPTIENDWVPPAKQSEISATYTLIAKPALQCMFDPLE